MSKYHGLIVDKKKKRISEALSVGAENVKFSVFDQAADEVLMLLYQNTYKKYLANERMATPRRPKL